MSEIQPGKYRRKYADRPIYRYDSYNIDPWHKTRVLIASLFIIAAAAGAGAAVANFDSIVSHLTEDRQYADPDFTQSREGFDWNTVLDKFIQGEKQ
jgi:hypothetical protein